MLLNNCRLNENWIKDRLNGNHHRFDTIKSKGLRKAAVLIPMLCKGDEWHLLYTRRTDTVQEHKGQVSFPGGALEVGDANLQEAAMREAREEIGLLPEHVRILGALDQYSTTSDFLITPIVGEIDWPFSIQLSKNEVSRVFTIPIQWLANRSHWAERPYTARDGKVHRVIFFEEYDQELLWGITARITITFLQRLGLI